MPNPTPTHVPAHAAPEADDSIPGVTAPVDPHLADAAPVEPSPSQDLVVASRQRLEAVQRMQDELEQAVGVAEAADGAVRVTVNPAGMPTRLEIREAAMTLPADQLADEIMAGVREAAGVVSLRVREIVGDVVPAEQLDALMRGGVAESDRREVREQLASGASVPGEVR